LKAGVRVPGLRVVDLKSGVLGVEWIDGWSVREVLGGGQEDDGLPEVDEEEEAEEEEEEEEDIAELLAQKGVSEGTERYSSHDLMQTTLTHMVLPSDQTRCFDLSEPKLRRCTSQKSFTEI
jgi:hypothetical protein